MADIFSWIFCVDKPIIYSRISETKGKTMTYHGHKNYQTWNVLLWINNDERLYNIAKSEKSYDDFVKAMKDMGDGAIAYETPDNVAWADPTIDRESINRDWVQDFVEDAA